MSTKSFTPRETVGELDRYVIGQHKAKRAVAVALRNRWRRQQVSPELRDEIAPKNIIMIGPTGCGKTEIARRLAKLAQAPFVKVEASKFTEVGYVGRDVESMIRDLVENAIQLVRSEAEANVKTRASEAAEEHLLDMLMGATNDSLPAMPSAPTSFGPFVVTPGPQGGAVRAQSPSRDVSKEREEKRAKLRAGELDDETIEIESSENANPFMTIFGQHGMEEMELNLKEMMKDLPGFRGKKRKKKVRVKEARALLEAEEAAKLVDMDRVKSDAIERTEQAGIVFIDEIDKVAGRQSSHAGPDVSREGVQRDLLPIVEGSTVSTKHGPVKTDHILFIAAGAFHVAKVADLIPELQGRFPIRVELEALGRDDFVRILREPKNALTRQYTALLATEGVTLKFTDDALDAIADFAAEANRRAENIGARRLHTVLEALLEDVSFAAPEMPAGEVVIDGERVKKTLAPILADEDLSRHIL